MYKLLFPLTAGPMKKQSLQHAASLRHHFRPQVENLEGRYLLATAFGTFAFFSGNSVPGELAGVNVQVRSSEFAAPRKHIGLSFVFHSNGTGNQAAVSVNRLSGGPVRTLGSRSEVGDQNESLTLVDATPGNVRVNLPAVNAEEGWKLEVRLTGDVDGNFRVDRNDLLLIQPRIGESTGEEGFLRQADIDGDGNITTQDWRLARTYVGVRTNVRPLVLVANLSPDCDRDGNGIVLVPQVTFTGQVSSGRAVTFSLGDNGESHQSAKVNKNGRFTFPLTVAQRTTSVRVTAKDRFGQQAVVEKSISLGDVILDWNAVQLTAIRDYTTLSQVPFSNRVVYTAPPLAARNLAMVHVAMFDAINAVERKYQPYYVDMTASPGTSEVAAAATAAHDVLVAQYPKTEQAALFTAALAESLASVPDGASKAAGIALGHQVADAILGWRSTDGARTPVRFTPGTDPGDWQLSPPGYLPPLVPQFAHVTPFAVPDIIAFRPEAPPDLDSAEYAVAFNEVKELGGFDSTSRTTDQTEVALFWADGPGTFTPAGHWNQIAEIVSLQRGNSLAENARLFALLNVAMADAGISCWDTKYFYALWRPITAIREADLDGNDLTEKDDTWAPLLKTPNFPTYTSGHSTFSGAAATVLTAFFGDNMAFSSRSDGLEGFSQRPLATTITRSFTSFEQAAEEAGWSRIYGGIHFEFDSNTGLAVGQAIGNYAVEHLMVFSD